MAPKLTYETTNEKDKVLFQRGQSVARVLSPIEIGVKKILSCSHILFNIC